MSHIVFYPWEGSRYKKENGIRLLLLGESHYGEPDQEPAQATKIVVQNWRNGESVRYLTAAARLLTGKSSWELDRCSDLDDIAFYNFVQFSMPMCGVRPTNEQGQDSQKAFREVLEALAPTHVLATGSFVWENMPQFDGRESRIQIDDGSLHEIGEYSTSRGLVLATVIPHLSRYFSPPRWRPLVQAFLSLQRLPTI